jgi:hypothetical protein
VLLCEQCRFHGTPDLSSIYAKHGANVTDGINVLFLRMRTLLSAGYDRELIDATRRILPESQPAVASIHMMFLLKASVFLR